SALWRERDSSARRCASTRSSRSPASSAATTSLLRRCVTAMSNPSAEIEAPLDPAAARILARVRWLMLISATTTCLAIAAVIGVIRYRGFKAEGSAGAGRTPLLPKSARVVSTPLAQDRIAATLDVHRA